MLKQYHAWKKRYPDCLLFFRVGDFYEMFFEDAKVASSVLDIALTARDVQKAVPMAGVPYHAVDTYLARLVSAGYRVAICEQMSEPDGKTLVDRSVIRVVTPGTYAPEEGTSEGHLAAIFSLDHKTCSVALLVPGTGDFEAGTLTLEEAISRLAAFAPGEILLPKGSLFETKKLLSDIPAWIAVEREREDFDAVRGAKKIAERWHLASPAALGFEEGDPSLGAAWCALRYLEETQFCAAGHIKPPSPMTLEGILYLDAASQRNLELVDGEGPTLYSVLNRCRTPMGKRKLKDWILHPTVDVGEITLRQSILSSLIENPMRLEKLQFLLSRCRDVERAVGRLSLKTGNPQDLASIRDTLEILPAIGELCGLSPLQDVLLETSELDEIAALLKSALNDSVPRLLKEGKLIRRGYDDQLDTWRELAENADRWLKDFEERERERSGIRSLKVGSNRVFGYYIEISKAASGRIPEDYIRRQTLVGAERYVTEELKKFEEHILSAAEEIQKREEALYKDLLERTLAHSASLQAMGSSLAKLDVCASLAEVAIERNYVAPTVDLGTTFEIRGGRHPVMEVALRDAPFTPNDVFLGNEGQPSRIAILTGPNMAGKSTYLRMAALLAIMAQMGSFIPAESSRIGILTRIFTRIGARDELSKGRSTFMVEMLETANILRNAGQRSLVVLDEVGRGTSTYDGLSIAWAILEYLHGKGETRPKVLFATHYHELTQLAEKLPGVVNLSMAVEETANGIVFLHQVVEMPASRSYGIDVARLAGIPEAVVSRSEELLRRFERGQSLGEVPPLEEFRKTRVNQLSLFPIGGESILEELAALDCNGMTPLAALETLYRLQERAQKVLGGK